MSSEAARAFDLPAPCMTPSTPCHPAIPGVASIKTQSGCTFCWNMFQVASCFPSCAKKSGAWCVCMRGASSRAHTHSPNHRFSPDVAKFYTCQIVLALEYLHSLGIVFRDLKPENILIGKDGYAKVTDFGFAKVLSGDRTYTFCGTPEYLAPEIIQSKGHDTSVDWWALGILVYEMLAGYPPFSDENPFGIYQKILSGKVIFPEHVPAAARDFVRKLLKADWTRRLGCQRGGAADVKRHRWFEELDWGTVLARVIPAPWLPPIAAEDDTRNFDEYPDSDGEGGAALSGKAATLFDDLGGF